MRYLKLFCMSLLLLLALSGCGKTELEDRCFPLLAAVEKNAHGGQVAVSYVYQQSQGDTFSVSSADFFKAWYNYEIDLNKVVDYNHLKVILIGQQFLEDETQRDEMLQMLENEERFPRNTYVCITDDVSGMLQLNESLTEDLGTYLEEMLENNEYLNAQGLPTLGTMFQERVNQKETIFYPYLRVQEEKPVFDEFYCIRRGETLGTVDKDSGYLAFLTAGKLDRYVLEIRQGEFLELRGFQCQYDLSEQGTVTISITCEGEMLLGENPGNEAVSLLVEKYLQSLSEEAQKRQIDLGNSYKKLGGYNREWYEKVRNKEDGLEYEENLTVDYKVKVLLTSGDVTK